MRRCALPRPRPPPVYTGSSIVNQSSGPAPDRTHRYFRPVLAALVVHLSCRSARPSLVLPPSPSISCVFRPSARQSGLTYLPSFIHGCLCSLGRGHPGGEAFRPARKPLNRAGRWHGNGGKKKKSGPLTSHFPRGVTEVSLHLGPSVVFSAIGGRRAGAPLWTADTTCRETSPH